MLLRHRLWVAATAGALLLSACGSDSTSSDTTVGAPTTAADPGGDDTTTIAPDSDTTISGVTDTTAATSDTPITDPNALAQAKVQAALETLPPDWFGTIASDLGEEGDGDNIVFAPCLGPDDYNLDNLDADSAASWELDAEAPDGTQASVEARVFADGAIAADAYAVLEKVLGTDEGRACLASVVPGALAEDAPAGATLDAWVEGTTIEGADVGARVIVSISGGGLGGEYYVDLVAARDNTTSTIFATFVSFGVPVDQPVASAMFTAAVNAG